MSALAVQEQKGFSLPDLIEQMRQLSSDQIDSIIAEIHQMDGDQAQSARDQVEAVRRLVGARKESERLRQDLGRIECHIIRRLGLLDAQKELPSHLRSPASHFAAMNEAEFNTALANYLYASHREVTAVRLWRFLTGTTANRHPYPEFPSHPSEADAALLRAEVDGFVNSLWRRGETVDLRLVDSADPDEGNSIADFLNEHAQTEAERVGLKRLIYEAIKDGTGEPTPADLTESVHVPEWVTVRGENGSFVHIPIRSATLEQLKWLVELRTEQARVMAAKASSLQDLADEFEKRYDAEGLSADSPIGGLSSWAEVYA